MVSTMIVPIKNNKNLVIVFIAIEKCQRVFCHLSRQGSKSTGNYFYVCGVKPVFGTNGIKVQRFCF